MIQQRSRGMPCLGNRVSMAEGTWHRSAILMLLLGLLISVSASGSAQAPATGAHDTVTGSGPEKAFVRQYCAGCHNDRLKTGGLSLQDADPAQVDGHQDVWEKVVRKLRANMMPPIGMRRADKASTDAFVRGLEAALDRAAGARPDPGRMPAFHRLNRTEYANVVRDVLGLEVDVNSWLPPDDSSYGFDNIADALTVSPLLMERYLSAARNISRLAVGSRSIKPAVASYPVSPELTQDDHIEGLPLGTRGGALVHHYMPLDGDYDIKVRLLRSVVDAVRGIQEPHQLEIAVDGERVKLFTVGGKSASPAVETPPAQEEPSKEEAEAVQQAAKEAAVKRAFEQMTADAGLDVRLPLKAGPHTITAAFLKKTSAQIEDVRQPLLRSYFDPVEEEGQPHVRMVTVGGPYNPTGPGTTPSRRRIFVCAPSSALTNIACARKIISTVGRRLYRRPLTPTDLQTLLGFFIAGQSEGGFDSGIEQVVRRLLVSPEFLFRVEQDPAGTAPASIYPLSDLALASRLSFFLWSSAPDDLLLALAERGRLSNPAVLEQQVKRMLADQRSRALVNNFAGQWLYLRNLSVASPDPQQFPDFDENLRQAMRQETELFFEDIVRGDRSIREFLSSNATFLNERLARHYGIPNVYGSQFRRVTLTDGNRAGLLGQSSLLTATSPSNRTSPVLRGKWILENVLGAPLPPPPANVPELQEKGAGGQVLSMRQRMEQHRANASCAVCHQQMDPLGLPLENFDAVGRWRTVSESNESIDASGALPDGSRFDGAQGLRTVLLGLTDTFATTFAEKLLTYGLGRGVELTDGPELRRITAAAARDDYRFSSIVLGIVKSTPFRMRRSQS